MTEEQKVLNAIKITIADLPQSKQDQVYACYHQLLDVLATQPDQEIAYYGLALLGAHKAAE